MLNPTVILGRLMFYASVFFLYYVDIITLNCFTTAFVS